MKKKKDRKLVLGIFIVLLIPIFILNNQVKLPYSLNTFCEVLPHKKWILAKETSGQLIVNLMDYQTGLANNFRVTQFQRGESVFFNSCPSLVSKRTVSEGDTIGVITASDVDEKTVELQGDLDIARAELAASISGEKKSMIDEAESRLKFSEARLKEKKDIFTRTEQLYRKGFETEEIYDRALSELKQLELETEINKAQLETIRSGLKPEAIGLIKSRITSLEKSLNVLMKKSSSFVIKSPINGMVNRSFSPDTIVSILDISHVVLNVPLKLSYAQTIHEGDTLKIQLVNSGEVLEGRVIFISRQVTFLQRQQVINTTIVLDNSRQTLLPGMIVEAKIMLAPITIAEHMKRFIIN